MRLSFKDLIVLLMGFIIGIAVTAKASDNSLTPRFSLIGQQTPVANQGERDTSASFTAVSLLESLLKKQSGTNTMLSVEYAYWAARSKTRGATEAVSLADALGELQTSGVPFENVWAYEPAPWYAQKVQHADCYSQFTSHVSVVSYECFTNGTPTPTVSAAPRLKLSKVQALPSTPEAISAMIRFGFSVAAEVDLYRNAWSLDNTSSGTFKKGIVNMPSRGDVYLGKQSILIVGYDLNSKTYLFKNSWGVDSWSATAPFPGYGLIPMDYVKSFGACYSADVGH